MDLELTVKVGQSRVCRLVQVDPVLKYLGRLFLFCYGINKMSAQSNRLKIFEYVPVSYPSSTSTLLSWHIFKFQILTKMAQKTNLAQNRRKIDLLL